MTTKKEKNYLAFRMNAGIRFDRPIDVNKHYISPGGYEFVMNGRVLQFDFCDYVGNISKNDPYVLEIEQRNPDIASFPDIYKIKKKDLQHVEEIRDFFVYTGEKEDEKIIPVKLEYIDFIVPSGVWECISVPTGVLDTACIGC